MFKLMELPYMPADKAVQLEQQLLEHEYVAEKDWLLERIKEIKSKSRMY